MSGDRSRGEDGTIRELAIVARSVTPLCASLAMERNRNGVTTPGGVLYPPHVSSYNTFVPQYSVDSEYLKSLLLGRLHPCELTEPVLSPSSFDAEEGSEGRRLTNDSGIQSPDSETSPPLSLPDTPDFFTECERELLKLFQFVERHLASVEKDLGTLAMAPSRRGKTKSSGGSSGEEDEEEEERYAGETTPLAGQIQVGPTAAGALVRLRHTLDSLRESIASSFSALDKLVELHDDATTSQGGRQFLDRYSPTKINLERRIDSNLDKVHTELRNHGLLDGFSDVRPQETESQVTVEVREYRPGCLTLLHALLFSSVWCILSFMYYYSEQHPTWAVTVRLLRSPFLIVLFFYFYGINIKVWANNYIDYVRIFGFPSCGTPTTKFAWKVAGMFCVVFTTILGTLLFLSILRRDIPVKLAATLMWIILLVFLFNPRDQFLRKGRFTFILVVFRILIAPFHTVYFGDFWFADQLNSLVGILLDMQYYVCFMVSDSWSDPPNKAICTTSTNGIRPIVSALPALWRFMQCLRSFYDERKFRHLVNAVKYFTTFPVIVFATLFSVRVSTAFSLTALDLENVNWIIVLWGLSSFVHALYTFLWDVYCDWGLFQLQHCTLLRPKRLYSWKSFYYIAIVLDLILRFSWTLKLTLALVWHTDSDIIYTVLVAGEMFRRFMWNFFRVEYQQTLPSSS